MIRLLHVAQQVSRNLEIDGKFFQRNGQRVFLKMVTYGPFPDPQPEHVIELARVKEAGFNAIRVYQSPTQELLNSADLCGLMVFLGFNWSWTRVFLEGSDQQVFEVAKCELRSELHLWAEHPAVVACFVANEIWPDVANWMGVVQTRQAIEELISVVKEQAGHLLAAYASYPSSEFLEPSNADFTAMNIYLEHRDDYQSYLRRLHHLAGDRPVVISEFGADSLSLGETRQSEVLAWGLSVAQAEGAAGWTCFSWSDRWMAGGGDVEGWAFGLRRKDDSQKPAAEVLEANWQADFSMPMFSVIICVYNGVDRVGVAVESLRELDYPNYEVIVVDDGSTDGTRDVLDQYPYITIIDGPHAGLSAARNAGALAANGEILAYTDDDCAVDRDYLFWLAKAYVENAWDACGGPNIPPSPEGEDEAVVASALGAPSHVMLDDSEAEHIPGCHLSVRKCVFESVGGFRTQYRTAGDDVDFCWRLSSAGYKIGFHGASFVWHRRRTSLMRYFRQQWGYGKAEAILMRDHPEKFSRGNGARWEGCVYTGGAVGAVNGSVIYHGPAGLAGYQVFWNPMMPKRQLHREFVYSRSLMKLELTEVLQPRLRRFARWWYGREWSSSIDKRIPSAKENKPRYLPMSEIVLPVQTDEYRARVVEVMLCCGWSLTGDYEQFDLVRGDQSAMLVSELIGNGSWGVRVRVTAERKDFLRVEREILSGLVDSD